MKILMFAHHDAGFFKVRKELVEQLIKLNHKLVICLPYGDLVPDIKALGCKYIDTQELDRRGTNPLSDVALYRRYKKIIKAEQPDAVITYAIKPNIYGGMAAAKYKVPYFINITGLGTAFEEGNAVKNIVRFLYGRANKNAKKVFFENTQDAEIMLSQGIVTKEQTVINTGAGVNVNDFPFTEYPKDDGVTRFLFIGRVMKAKGVDELFGASKRLKSKYGDAVEIHFVGPFEENYSDITNELKNKKIIIYHGFQSDVRPFIKDTSCHVLPSYHEGMANTLLECASMGRPLITSNIHGCMEAVEDGKTGLLVGTEDEDDLYSKMERFVLMPYEQKVIMGKASADFVHKNFDRKKVVDNTIKEIGA